MQQQKLSFDKRDLEDLENFDASIENPPPAGGRQQFPTEAPVHPDQRTNPDLFFDADTGLHEKIERLKQAFEMDRSHSGDVKVTLSNGAENTGSEPRSFKEFLLGELSGSPLPPNFTSHVTGAIGSIEFGLADSKRRKHLHEYTNDGRLGVLLKCDIDECNVSGPYSALVDGREGRKGNVALTSVDSSTLLIIGSEKSYDLEKILSDNTQGFRDSLAALSERINAPVYYFYTDRHNASGESTYHQKPGAIMHPDGSYNSF